MEFQADILLNAWKFDDLEFKGRTLASSDGILIFNLPNDLLITKYSWLFLELSLFNLSVTWSCWLCLSSRNLFSPWLGYPNSWVSSWDFVFWLHYLPLEYSWCFKNSDLLSSHSVNSLFSSTYIILAILTFWKRWEYQTTWPASWETCIQVRKQQLELDGNDNPIRKTEKETQMYRTDF